MKTLICSLIVTTLSTSLMAKAIFPVDDGYAPPVMDLVTESTDTQDMKVLYLTKLLEQQQKSYDEQIKVFINLP